MTITFQVHPQAGPVIQRAKIEIPEDRLRVLEQMGEPPPTAEFAAALVDTGASQTQIDETLIRRLGLSPIATTRVFTSTSGKDHPATAYIYDASITLTNDDRSTLTLAIPVIGCATLHVGCGVILGRDILNRCYLTYAGPDLQGTLRF